MFSPQDLLLRDAVGVLSVPAVREEGPGRNACEDEGTDWKKGRLVISPSWGFAFCPPGPANLPLCYHSMGEGITLARGLPDEDGADTAPLAGGGQDEPHTDLRCPRYGHIAQMTAEVWSHC